MTNINIFRQSLKIINSLWLRAGLIYFLGHVTLLESVGLGHVLRSSFHTPWLRLIDKSMTWSLEVFVITWACSEIIETISHESPAPGLDHFKKILREGAWVIVTAIIIPPAIHFIIWLSVGNNALTVEMIAAFLCPGIALWSAYQIIKNKYNSASPEGIKELPFSRSMILTSALILAASFLTCALGLTMQQSIWATPLISILSTQIYFLAFAIFAHKIMARHPAIHQKFTSTKTLILIDPGGSNLLSILSIFLRSHPPFFIVLKSLTPPDYHVLEFIRFFWQERYYRPGALVAISCYTSNCSEAYAIARGFRQHGSKVIIGGPHVSFFPDEALEFCDSVVTGPAESVWETIVHDFENNALKPVYNGNYSPQAQNKTYQYLLHAPVNIASSFIHASRGCKFNCNFCAIPSINGPYLQERSIEEIIALIRHVAQEKKHISFIDNNLFIDPVFTKNLLRAMIPLKIHWFSDISIDVAKDDEALMLLKESGCSSLLIGFEIIPFSKETSRGGKYTYANDYIALARKIQKMGIKIRAQFIFGFEKDTWKSLWRLWVFCLELAPFNTSVSFLTPIPGSRHLEKCINNESIINLNWCRYNMIQQTTSHPNLKQPFLLQKGYLLVVMFIFVTTSTMGRIILCIAIFLALFLFLNISNIKQLI
ncbi:MAG: radical SAM protein [Candidatus Omnitrophota bacterium]